MDAKLKWYIHVPAVPDVLITVDLQRQAFVVPHSDGAYYSLWNTDEFPLGDFHMLPKKGDGYMKGWKPYISNSCLVACQTDLAGAVSNGIALATIQGLACPAAFA